MLPHVDTASGHHRCRARGTLAGRGGPLLRSQQGLGQQARRALPHRGAGGVRATIAAPQVLTDSHPAAHRRTHRRPAPPPRRAGSRRRPRHHRLAPWPTRHEDLTRHDRPYAYRRRPGHPAAAQAAPQLIRPLRRRAAERHLAGRLHPLPPRRRHRRRDPHLARRPLPLRPAHRRPPAHHRPDSAHRLPHHSRRPRRARQHPDRQRHGLHHPLRRRPRRTQRPGTRTTPTARRPEELPAQPPHHLRQG